MPSKKPPPILEDDVLLEEASDASEPDLLEEPEAHLQPLEARFMQALDLVANGRIDAGVEGLQSILREEPRLAEPRLELARIWLDMDRLDDAEEEAREAIRILETGGQWTLDLSPQELMAHACTVLGEILHAKLETDDVIFGERARFEQLVSDARQLFQRAAALDPANSLAARVAMGLGTETPEA